MDSNWPLQSSIYMLNQFCADTDTFSVRALARLKLKGLALQVNVEQETLTLVIYADQDYQMLRKHLIPQKRLYQLLGLHFKKVQIVYGLPNESVENSVHLETISLNSSTDPRDLRDPNSLGARLRRAINIALQGHIGVLWLHNEHDIENLEALWKRGRVAELFQKHEIMYCYDVHEQSVKLGKPDCLEDSNRIVITID
jgi:hypothetical protein